MKVLIYGLSGAGKTYIAQKLMDILGDRAEWFNADKIRSECDDWDFSKAGRKRQNQRMLTLANIASQKGKIAICDFICPTETGRESFNADYEVFVDTVESSEYSDTDKIFERPDYENYPVDIPHHIVTEQRGDTDAIFIGMELETLLLLDK